MVSFFYLFQGDLSILKSKKLDKKIKNVINNYK